MGLRVGRIADDAVGHGGAHEGVLQAQRVAHFVNRGGEESSPCSWGRAAWLVSLVNKMVERTTGKNVPLELLTGVVDAVTPPMPNRPGGRSANTTSPPGALPAPNAPVARSVEHRRRYSGYCAWNRGFLATEATRKSELLTPFQTAAACLIWLKTEAKSSLTPSLAGPGSVTRNVTVLLGSCVRSNFSNTGVL